VEAGLLQAEGGVTQASATRASASAAIDQSQADLEAAESRRDLAQLDFTRASNLLDARATSQAEADSKKAALDQAVGIPPAKHACASEDWRRRSRGCRLPRRSRAWSYSAAWSLALAAAGMTIGPSGRARSAASSRSRVRLQYFGASSRTRVLGQLGRTRKRSRRYSSGLSP
jgi:hypothetical protein